MFRYAAETLTSAFNILISIILILFVTVIGLIGFGIYWFCTH